MNIVQNKILYYIAFTTAIRQAEIPAYSTSEYGRAERRMWRKAISHWDSQHQRKFLVGPVVLAV